MVVHSSNSSPGAGEAGVQEQPGPDNGRRGRVSDLDCALSQVAERFKVEPGDLLPSRTCGKHGSCES